MSKADVSPVRLLTKAVRHPGRALLRLVLRSRLARTTLDGDRARLFDFLADRWGADGPALQREYRESAFARWYERRRQALSDVRGPYRMGTTNAFDCEALYLLVRAMRPNVVIETGVLYGAVSGHILAAMAFNGGGTLYSIERGGVPGEPPHDFLVPPGLASRWQLIMGDSRIELPPLLARLGRVDLFHHDSLHTWEHMMWEFETAMPHLAPNGVLSSHDVLVAHSVRQIFGENAFSAFCRQHALPSVIIRNFGFAFPAPR